jgi:hypothetical protein
MDSDRDSDVRSGGDREGAASEIVGDADENLVERIVDRITPDARYTRTEFIATIILAIAAILTAWAALQSAKWSGEQAIHFSQAGANRTESVRFDNRATSLILLDEQTFMQWGAAIQADLLASQERGVEPSDPTTYDPANPTASGYFFTLFRDEFQSRVTTWLEGGGPLNPSGSSPFLPLDEYVAESVPALAESVRLAGVADEKAALAATDNQNSDDYVVAVVILAATMFFAGVSSKMKSRLNLNLMVGLATVMLTWAVFRLATLPIHAVP